ncbi:hypothetical protein [Wenyingzhuangia sp. 2_MG-2023]|uniref:hypothetical protein n=1 Tax=Wenyingzhuangia sp. 2_MG-2023 TaxID=3062639 RepID=UPI0026E4332C|nr:hypothetical protein [Wenyingzhuangia sp. 2_MG-2023]MDO6738340.1 hypothetical protein [Wenyingzhuangia sp. 2_MG-2023]MDO6803914.1 hypothetical protein [Wenyingzhuangia sp. 1_MG-2023]
MALYILLTGLLIACQESKEKSSEEVVVNDDRKYFNPKDEFIQFDTLVTEGTVYKDSISSWKGYQKVKETLEKLKKNTPNDVLNISDELVGNVVLMRDSITVDLLKIKGMRARIHTLYNQSLRLQEMKDIPAITVPEIKKQTQGLFVIFRMINRKITAIYQQVDFENELENDEFFFSKIDSIR